MTQKSNPAVYFEIPVNDMARAMEFYKNVFDFQFETDHFENIDMAYFPFSDEQSGISGALAKGEIYKPTKDGILIYFNTNNIELSLKKAQNYGAEVLFPATFHQDLGFAVAEIQDSEGNRIGLHQKLR
ncbi:VOC family protein [Chryseobacterium sp. T1]